MANRKKGNTAIFKEYIEDLFCRGFIVTDMYADGEFNFDSIKHGILPVILNICATGEHVPKIERTIKAIK